MAAAASDEAQSHGLSGIRSSVSSYGASSHGSYAGVREVAVPPSRRPSLVGTVVAALARALRGIPRRSARDWVPALEWGRAYTRDKLTADAVAGMTVAVMLIPQSLSYALLAGLPPIYGMYTSTVPLLVYALLGKSSRLQVGPVATTAILVQSSVASLVGGGGSDGSAGVGGGAVSAEETLRVTLVLTLVAGAVQVAMGLLRFGFLATLLSWPVMSGFMSAAACIIAVSQLRDLLGLAVAPETTFLGKLGAAVSAAGTAHAPTVALSVLCVAFLLYAKQRKFFPRWLPAQLVAAGTLTFLSWGMSLNETLGVQVLGSVPAGLPTPALPATSIAEVAAVLPQAVVVAVVSYVGSISLVVAFAQEAREPVDANQELVAMGSACIVGSCFAGHTVSGSFTRTALNNELEPRSPLAGAFTGLSMMATLLVLAPFFASLPKCVLASMILVSVRSLVKVDDARALWRASRDDFWQFVVCFAAVLGFGLDRGIVTAVAFSLVNVVYRAFYPHMQALGELPVALQASPADVGGATAGDGASAAVGADDDAGLGVGAATDSVFVPVSRYPDAAQVPGVKVCSVDGPLNFGNVGLVADALGAMLDASIGAPTEGSGAGHHEHRYGDGPGSGGGRGDDLEAATLERRPLQHLGADEGGDSSDGDGEGVLDLPDAVVSARALPPSSSAAVVVDCTRVTDADATACRRLRDVVADYRRKNVALIFAAMPGETRDVLRRFRLFSPRRSANFVQTVAAAIALLKSGAPRP